MVQPLSGPSRLLASGFGHPRLRMVQPLSGLSRLLASVRIWPDERYGVEEMAPSQPSVRFRLEMLPLPSGRGGGEGSHSRLSASVRIGRSSDYRSRGKVNCFF